MSRNRLSVWCLFLLAIVSAACLGEDWKSSPVGASEQEHGWLLQVEPDEEFDVLVIANTVHPDLPWVISEYDPAIITPTGSDVDANIRTWGDWDMSSPEEDPQFFIPMQMFNFAGAAVGQTPLVLEVRNGDELVEVLEITVSVVDDACATDSGLKASRCGHDPRDEELPEGVEGYGEGFGVFEELDHGWLINMEPGDTVLVRLSANAVHPDTPWRVAELDPAVIQIRDTQQDTDVRVPGDWDTSDAGKPPSFLATTSFTVVAVDYGRSPLVLEVVDEGERVDVYELTVAVVADACATDTGLNPCHN